MTAFNCYYVTYFCNILYFLFFSHFENTLFFTNQTYNYFQYFYNSNGISYEKAGAWGRYCVCVWGGGGLSVVAKLAMNMYTDLRNYQFIIKLYTLDNGIIGLMLIK